MNTMELELIRPTSQLHPVVPSESAPGTIEMVSRLAGLRQILVPLDFSVLSERAISFAVTFARQFGASITLLHVVDAWPCSPIRPDGDYESDKKAMGLAAKSRLEILALARIPADLRVRIEVRWGTPWHVIAGAVGELSADLIILTTHGFTGLKHVLLGSTAERVSRHAPCPVLIVRERECGSAVPEEHGAMLREEALSGQQGPQLTEQTSVMQTSTGASPTLVEPAPAPEGLRASASALQVDLVPQILHLKSILVPIDFSDTSEKALAYALPFAEQFGARLSLVHVMDLTVQPIEYGFYEADHTDYNTAAQKRLELFARERLPATLPKRATVALRVGIPWLEVCNYAKECGTDLIILTTHGYTGLKRVLLGSTAERVVQHAPCPVLVVREKGREFT